MQGDTILAFAYKTGYPVYTDPVFSSGTNSVGVYNNKGNGKVICTRITYTDAGIDAPGTGSDYVVQIKTIGEAAPGCGGFVQSIPARANAIFVQIFRALVPVGRSLHTASNNMGDTYKDEWLTSTEGTGKWEWYARRVICGKTGTMSSGGHVYINGTAGTEAEPVIWYLGACNLYDLTKFQYDGLRTRYADSANSATKLTTARSLWGNSFDGTADIGGTLTPDGNRTRDIGSDTAMWDNAHIRGIGVRHIDAATQSYITDGQLHIGYGSVAPTKAIYLYYSADTTSRTKFFEVNSDGAYALTRFGVNGQNTLYNFYTDGTSYFTDTLTVGARVTSTAPSALTNVDRIVITPYYHTGGPWKITSRDDNTNAYLSLYYNSSELLRIRHDGIQSLDFKGNATSATYLKDRTNSTASYLNYGAAGLAASAITWLCCWNGYEVRAISKAEMANAVDSAHKWVRIGGDTMTGDLLFSNSATTTRQIRGIVGDNDYWRVAGGATAANAGWMEIATADDGNEPIYVRQYTGAYTTITRTLTLLDASGNTTFPGDINISHAIGDATLTASSKNPRIIFSENGAQPVHIAYTDLDSYRAPAGLKVVGGASASKAWFEIEGNVYFGGDGIYHVGTAATQRIIRIIDSGDQYGTGVSIGAGGLALFGGGESANTLISSLSLTAGGTETTYISSDNSIEFYPNQNSYDASSHITMTNGSIWAGVAGNTTRENNIGVRSGAGGIYMYSQASASGSRGLYLQAHGSGTAKGIITVDTNNNTTFTGTFSGNASSATRINGNLGAVSDANGHNIWVSSTSSADGIPKYVANCYITASTGTLTCTKVKNAVWNDYAECRRSIELEPGRCVRETASASGMIRTTQRLMPGCKFVSDTYGALMGETKEAKTPIAVSGRVLAYPYRNRNDYPLGAAVCSAPNGTVDIMTREEIMTYPERIVGTVSEIPDYEIWHGGDKECPSDIQVNDRIWIYVR